MTKLLLISAACLALAACQTPTVYAPAAGPQASGYSEMRIEPDRWRVTFNGGSGADAARVGDLALLRAAELTLQQGYDWFRVADRTGGARGGSGPYVSLGGGSADFGRHSAIGVGGGVGFDLSGGPRISQTIEVLMGHGPAPREPDAYDARSIKASIRPEA